MSQKLEVNGLFFSVSDPFSAGHVCNEAEAVALNSTRRENLRRAFGRTLQKEFPDDKVDFEKASALFAELDATYVFSKVRLPLSQDPVEIRARAMATDLANAALRAKNMAKDNLLPGKFDELVQKILDTKPEIREEAKQRVQNIQALAGEIAL